MNSLLDYGSSSSESEEESVSVNPQNSNQKTVKLKLPKPALGENALHTSVFSNPFAEAELAKAAILEKHVKMVIVSLILCYIVIIMIFVKYSCMKGKKFRRVLYPFVHTIVKYIGDDCKVPGKGDTQMINGKKICWNYRKGRCRFGHNCKYAHDSDIQKSKEEIDDEKQQLKSVVCEATGTTTSAPPPHVALDPISPTDDALWEGGSDKRKLKRPGLSKGLIPGKKVIKMYQEQKIKDTIRK